MPPHALAVKPELQGKGIGKIVVENIIKLAKVKHKKAIRLDVLGHVNPRSIFTENVDFILLKQRTCITKIPGGQSINYLN